MYSVIYRMNKLANFTGKERDEYKLKASICAGITNGNDFSSCDQNVGHSLKQILSSTTSFLILTDETLKFDETASCVTPLDKYFGVIQFLVHMNSHNFTFDSDDTEIGDLCSIYSRILLKIHKRLLFTENQSQNLKYFMKLRGEITDLLFLRKEQDSVSKFLSDTESFLQGDAQWTHCNVRKLGFNGLLSYWKELSSVLYYTLDDFYSSWTQSYASCMVVCLQNRSNLIHSKISFSQSDMQKLLDEKQSKKFSLEEMRVINSVLDIWTNISRRFKQIQLNLAMKMDSADSNTHSEQPAGDNLNDLLGEPFQNSETATTKLFDVNSFDSILFYDNPSEYSWDKMGDSYNLVHPKKPKSALKKSNDEPICLEKTNLSGETETIVWEPVYTMNKSLMKCLVNFTLQTLQDYANQLQLGCNPTAVNLMNSRKDCLKQCTNGLNTEYYNCLNMLLQTPVFATSAHGPLFNVSDISISDFWCHRDRNILEEQFNPGFTTQNMLCSWGGAVGTAAGLPMPQIYISSSLQTFIAFSLEVLLPMILNLLQVDTDDKQSKSQSNKNQNLNSNSDNEKDILNKNQSLSDSNDDNPQLLILSIINLLLTILNGHGINTSIKCGDDDDDADTTVNNGSSSTEFVGLTAQLSTITLSVDWDLSGIERLAICISDCLSLRAFCSLLASVFQKPNESLFKISKFNGQDEIASLFLGCVKEYDVSIRLLSEQITDISLVYYYKIGFTIGEDLKCFNELKLLLPNHLKLQPLQSVLPSESNIENLSKPIHLMWFILSNIWSILIQTCPSGLARQIMAHVSSKILESAVQQLHITKTKSDIDHFQFRDGLWFVLGIAKFSLYRSAETISEVLGLGNLSVELNTIHTTALLTAQMLISCYTPKDLWNKLHEEGFYSQVSGDKNKTFDFSLSNWLRIADPALFQDIPIHLMKEQPQQTELEIEIKLLSASAHFDPVRIISLLTSWNYKISLLILESPYLNESMNLLTTESKLVARQVFIAISRILDAVPEYADFLGKVIETAVPRSETNKLFSRTKLNHEEWPLWFTVLVELMTEPLERVWIHFKELKQQRLEEDESFQDHNLRDKLNENPEVIFANYTPKRRAYWNVLFPSNQMPCGCSLPEPFHFNNTKRLYKCSSNTIDNSDGSTSTTSTKQQSNITLKLESEQETSNYLNYYQKGGCSKEAWFELVYDIIRLPVINCSAGIQLALAKINDIAMMTKDKQIEHSQKINNDSSNLFFGQHFAIHLVVLFLNYRIHQEIERKLFNGEYENQEKSAIERLQYLILLEYLCSLLDVNDENEEIHACKRRTKSFLEERKSEGSDSESFIPGNSSKIFKNVQNLRFVQHKALPDLFFMHEFLYANTMWINELIQSRRISGKSPTQSNPCFQLDETFNPSVYFQLNDSTEEINWEKVYCINVGLQEL
ncbi:unnamed protein product [Heterobilharzia americana]|nr:unnamed protein product [Heterobilharzia americana]